MDGLRKYLTSLAEAGIYDVIFTTTDVMRYCVNETHKLYPDQKFVLIDSDLASYLDQFDGGVILIRSGAFPLTSTSSVISAAISAGWLRRATCARERRSRGRPRVYGRVRRMEVDVKTALPTA